MSFDVRCDWYDAKNYETNDIYIYQIVEGQIYKPCSQQFVLVFILYLRY
jgi:hypothetical protein